MATKQARDVPAQLPSPAPRCSPPLPISALGPVRLGLAGVGRWGQNLLRVLSDTAGATLLSVADPRPLAPVPGVLHAAELEQLLTLPALQAVVIATPSALHAAHATLALRAGRHVFVEKPLALTTPSARSLCELAEARGLCLMVGHILRYHPALLGLQRLLETQALGRPQRVDLVRLAGRESTEDPWWCLAPHDLSLLEFLLGSPIAAIACSERAGRVISQVRTQAELPARVEVGFGALKHSHVEVQCEGGVLRYDPSAGLTVTRAGEPARAVRVAPAEPLRLEMEHFIRCVQTGAEPLTSGAEGLRVVSALEAGDRSRALAGCWQDVATWPS